jgi:hypothetical protein
MGNLIHPKQGRHPGIRDGPSASVGQAGPSAGLAAIPVLWTDSVRSQPSPPDRRKMRSATRCGGRRPSVRAADGAGRGPTDLSLPTAGRRAGGPGAGGGQRVPVAGPRGPTTAVCDGKYRARRGQVPAPLGCGGVWSHGGADGYNVIVVPADARLAAAAGMGVAAIGHSALWSAGNSVPGSSGTGSGGTAPTSGGGKKLVRYGGPDTAERLAADAAKAESTIGYHGVSAMLRNPPGFPHGQADFGEAAKVFPIIKTGTNPSHYTVILPKPVTQEVADLFNSIFKSTGT